jgi:hypothetical protein
MDDLPKHLSVLVDGARSAHDPSAEDARRVGKALGVAVPGFVAISSAGEAAVHAAELASGAPHASMAAKSTLLAAATAMKWLGVVMTVAVVGAAATLWSTSRDREASTSVVAKPGLLGRSEVVNVPVQAQTPAPALAQEPSRERPELARGRVRERASRPKPPVAPAAGDLTGELALIERAARALRDHDAALAERILTEHAARFPHGTLREERTGLSIIALCEQGRIAEAAPLRRRFVADAAQSPLVSRIARACDASSRGSRSR